MRGSILALSGVASAPGNVDKGVNSTWFSLTAANAARTRIVSGGDASLSQGTDVPLLSSLRASIGGMPLVLSFFLTETWSARSRPRWDTPAATEAQNAPGHVITRRGRARLSYLRPVSARECTSTGVPGSSAHAEGADRTSIGRREHRSDDLPTGYGNRRQAQGKQDRPRAGIAPRAEPAPYEDR
jgi:hypothetical protein